MSVTPVADFNCEIAGAFVEPVYYDALIADPEFTRSTLVRGATRMPVVCR